jgi:hypothetical protein
LRTVTDIRRLGTNAKVIGLANVPGKLGISGSLAPTIGPAITATRRAIHAGGGWLIELFGRPKDLVGRGGCTKTGARCTRSLRST